MIMSLQIGPFELFSALVAAINPTWAATASYRKMVDFQHTEIDIPGYLGFMYSFLMVVCIVIVVYYAEPGFPWHTYLTLIVGYFCSFGVLLLVPIDIAVVIVDRRSTFPSNDPTYNNHVKTLSAAYSTFFTIILIFGSFVLVFEEYYNTDGEFMSSWMRLFSLHYSPPVL